MKMHNTPSLLEKYNIDDCQTKIDTEISVGYLRQFEHFLQTQNLKNIRIGYYSVVDEFMPWASLTKIRYSTDFCNYEENADIMYINIKFGSLEKFFRLRNNII